MDESVAEAFRLLVADVYELAGLSRRSSEEIAASSGQTVARWHVMSALSDGPLTVPAVAERLGLTRQSVQRVADELLDDGLVVRRPNPGHRRSPLLRLTASGRRRLRVLVRDSDADRAGRLGATGLTRRELLEARRTVRSVVAALRGQAGPARR